MGTAIQFTDRLDRIRSMLRHIRPQLAVYYQSIGVLEDDVPLDLALTISEEQIKEFERHHQVELPPDFHVFLCNLGNGGVGPGYGMFGLDVQKGLLKMTTASTVGQDSACWGIPLADMGCGMEWRLILRGWDAGNMWFSTEGGNEPCVPKCGFLDWYESWLLEEVGISQSVLQDLLIRNHNRSTA